MHAGVALAPKGTFAASLSAAGRLHDGAGAIIDDPALGRAKADLAAAGVHGVRFWLLLTDRRLLLVSRTLLNRAGATVLDVPIADVASITTSTAGQSVTLHLPDDVTVALETPKAFRFLPDVYHRLPSIVEDLRPS